MRSAEDVARSFEACAAAIREWADVLAAIEPERNEGRRRVIVEGVSDAAASWLGDALERVSRSLCGRDVALRSEAAAWSGELALFALDRLAAETIAAGRGISRVGLFHLVADAERRNGCDGTQALPTRTPVRRGDDSCADAASRRWLS